MLPVSVFDNNATVENSYVNFIFISSVNKQVLKFSHVLSALGFDSHALVKWLNSDGSVFRILVIIIKSETGSPSCLRCSALLSTLDICVAMSSDDSLTY